MPQGPQGRRPPADVIGDAVYIARIATVEADDTKLKHPAKRASGPSGAKARGDSVSETDRREIAKLAAEVR